MNRNFSRSYGSTHKTFFTDKMNQVFGSSLQAYSQMEKRDQLILQLVTALVGIAILVGIFLMTWFFMVYAPIILVCMLIVIIAKWGETVYRVAAEVFSMVCWLLICMKVVTKRQDKTQEKDGGRGYATFTTVNV